MRQVQVACQTPIAAFRMKSSSASSSRINSSNLCPSTMTFSIIIRRSQGGPSSNLAITSVIILFLGLTTPILRTLSV